MVIGSEAYLKSIRRQIVALSGRLVGILVIVGLGVSVFAGFGSTGVTMKQFGADFYQEHNFMDIQLLGTYGFVDKDIQVIQQLEGVQAVQPAFYTDTLLKRGDSSYVVRMRSMETGDNLYTQINFPRLISGKFPEQSNEILIDPTMQSQLGLSIGDTLILESGTSQDIRNSLRTNTFQIVGVAQSPLYFMDSTESAAIGSGSVNYYALLPKQGFLSDVYTEIFIKAEGSDQLYTYGTAYQDMIDPLVSQLEDLGDVRSVERRNEVERQNRIQIEQSQQKLEQSRLQALGEFDDTQDELNSQTQQLIRGNIDLGSAQLEIAAQYKTLNSKLSELQSGLQQVSQGYLTLSTTQQTLDSTKSTLEESEQELNEGEAELIRSKSLALGSSGELDEGIQKLDAGIYQSEVGLQQIEFQQQTLEGQKNILQRDLQQAIADRDGIQAQINATGTTPVLAQQLQDANDEIQSLQQQSNQTTDDINQLSSQYYQLSLQRDDLLEQLDQATQGMEEVKTSLRTIRLKRLEINASRIELEQGFFSLDIGYQMLMQSRAQLASQEAQLLDGAREIETARIQLENAEAQLAQNSRLATRSAAKLEEAKEEFDQVQAQTLKQIEQMGQELQQASRQLDDLKDPTWYVLDRDKNMGYYQFKADADSIQSLGYSIPILFFLVAALMSLTTMSRLVEEQRLQIGTLKALGYGNGIILSKYLMFAIVPTFVGSVIGGLIGLQVFPRVVLEAYSMVFIFPPFSAPINWTYWGLGTMLAIICTVGATLSSCLQELKEKPANLLLPKPPKAGKKNFLERITPFWSRLSFLQKVTVRNIFRYKKRFFMTLLGVGGCTALLVLGIGLKSAVSGIVGEQYGNLVVYDMAITFQENAPISQQNSVERKLLTSGEASEIISLREESVDVYGSDSKEETATLIVPKSMDSFDDFYVLQERVSKQPLILGDDGVIINEKLASVKNISIGDSITLKNQDDEEYEVVVSGICESYFMHSVYMSADYYHDIFGEKPEFNTLSVRLNPYMLEDANQDELGGWLMDQNSVSAVSFTSSLVSQFEDTLDSLDLVIWVIIVVAGALAFVVLLNLTNINIVERMRELATIEVLGFRDFEVAEYLYRETLIVAFISACVGAFAGKFLTQFVLGSVEPDHIMFQRGGDPMTYVIAILVTMFFAVLVSLITSPKLKKIDMVEALKSNE